MVFSAPSPSPMDDTGSPTLPSRGLRALAASAVAALPPAALAALLLVRPGREWSWQLGRWAAGVRPLSGSLALDAAILAAIGALAFGLLGARLRRRVPLLLALALAAGQALCLAAARPHLTAGTGIAWGVDHPAFLYRLHEIRAVFPHLGGYNPWWNGGTEHFFSVTSGTHGWAILVSPLLAFLDPAAFEGWAVFAWLFVLFPWLAALSLRACGARWSAALAGGLLQLALGRACFLYFWQYGIVGGLTTVGLTVPLCALAYRTAVLRRGGWGGAALLGAVAWISSLWSPGLFTCAGLALGAVCCADRWTRRSFARMAFAAALALALLAPWLWTTLVVSHGVVGFVGASPGSDHSHLTLLYHGLRHAARRALEWHPAVLALGLAGLPLAPRRLRRLLLPCLLALGAVVVSYAWKRQSQFDRIAFQAAAVAAVPAAALAGRILSRAPRGGAARRAGLAAAQGIVLAALLLGVRVAVAHAGNAAGFRFWTAEPVVAEFADWVRANVPPGGRLAFAGPTGNRLDWGTATYLPILSGREMMAADYYSFPRGFVELDYPPRFYRNGGAEAILEFSRAYGITHWAVCNPAYVEKCFGREPDRFVPVARFRMQSTDLPVFAVAAPWAAGATRLLEGEGEVEARERRIVVRPADPAAERLVLRYNWRDGLRCLTPGASIEPFAFDGNIRLVAVHPGGAPEVVIGYRATGRPLAPNFDGTFHH